MKKLLFLTSIILFASSVNAQYFISATEIYNFNGYEVKQNINNQGYDADSMTINGIRIYKISYNTIDVFGDPTIASGALFVPQIACDSLPLVSYQHGTEFVKQWVPSNYSSGGPGFLYSGNGYITTLPDYLGMGDNPGLHPYVHWESEATASIDLIRAAREYLNNSLQIWDNNQLFLAGYSQGGHSTMAVHKYITVNNLQSEFNVVASAPMSGAFPLYDVQLPGMIDEDSSYYASAFLPYALASYQLVYGNLYDNYNEYYDPPYDSLIADWLASGTHDFVEWSAMLPVNFYDFMQDSVLDNMLSNPNHPINIDIRENDLHNWIPEEPVRMFYCGMDSMVFPENSTMAQDTMIALGATDILALNLDPNADHSGCGIPAHTNSLEWFNSFLSLFPAPIVDAGEDVSMCSTSRYNTNPTISNEKTLLWTTTGDGNILWADEAQAQYKPSQRDIENGQVSLVLTVYGWAIGSFAQDTLHITIENCTGIQQIDLEDQITVMPNPSKGVFTLALKNIVNQHLKIELVDFQGRVIFTQKLDNLNGNYSNQLDLGHHPSGTYFLRIFGNEDVVVRKLIKQ